MRFIVVLGCIVCSFAGRLSAQQNIQFSQYIFNSLSVNPAYAGYKEEWFAQLALRAQWVGMEGAPQTASASIDGILDPRDRKTGVGLQLTSDKLGAQYSTTATLNYAYRLQLDPEDTRRLSFGLGVGVTQYGIKSEMLRTIDEGDQSLPTGNENKFKPDVRLGVFYNSNFWYMGVSVLDFLSKPSNNGNYADGFTASLNIARRPHAYLIAGALVNLSPDMRIRPSLLIKEDFKGPTSADLNIMAILSDKVWLGGSYRTGINLKSSQEEGISAGKQNSISGIVQFYVNERFRVGYSYDFVTSQLASNQHGSHEISLGLAFGKVPRSFICPRVF